MDGFTGGFEIEGAQARGGERLSCSFLSNVRTDGVRNVRIRLCDISERGFMAECHEPVPLGGTVSIDLPGLGPTHARVRWGMGGRIGGRFMQPIDLQVCREGIAEATRTT